MKKLTQEQINKALEWVEAENKRYSDLMQNIEKTCENGFHEWKFDHYIDNRHRSYYEKCTKCGSMFLEIS